jgi:hypothetical protein
MALKKIIDIGGSLLLQTPYGQIDQGQKSIPSQATIRVKSISGTKKFLDLRLHFECDNKMQFEKNYSVEVSVSDGSPNFIKQAYLELKKLPEFSDAIDC